MTPIKPFRPDMFRTYKLMMIAVIKVKYNYIHGRIMIIETINVMFIILCTELVWPLPVRLFPYEDRPLANEQSAGPIPHWTLAVMFVILSRILILIIISLALVWLYVLYHSLIVVFFLVHRLFPVIRPSPSSFFYKYPISLQCLEEKIMLVSAKWTQIGGEIS